MHMRPKIAALAIAAAPMLLLAGCSKPEASEVNAAVVKEAKAKGVDDATAKKIADCAAPKMVDQLSASTLNKIVDDGFTGTADADDVNATEKILTECSK